jgi:O-antigen ligase
VRSPLLSLGGAVAIVFIVGSFRSLALGTALFAVLTFFNLFPVVGGTSASLVKMAGGVLILAWLPELARRGTLVPSLLHEQPMTSLAALGLAGWAFLSALWAVDGSAAVSSAARLLQGIVLIFIVASAIRDRSALRLVCWGYVGGATLTAIVGLAGGSSQEQIGVFTDTSRLSGGIGDPNEFAAVLLPALWIAAFGLAAVRNTLGRSLLVTATVLIALSIFYTESRGGLIGLGVTFLAAPFLAGRARGRTIATLLLVAAVGLVYYVVIAPPQAIERVTHFTAQGGTGRTDAWKIALQIYRNHPLTGIGLGNFEIVEPSQAAGNTNLVRPDLIVNTPIVVHNTYLHILTELGPIGLALLVVFLFGVLRLAVGSIRQLQAASDWGTEMLGRGMVIGACGMLASMTFISGQSGKQLWLLFAMMTALPAVARSVLRPATAEPTLARPIPAPAR